MEAPGCWKGYRIERVEWPSQDGVWLDEQAPQVLPESLTGKAISYARNQWDCLRRYVEDGDAPVDNNVIERDIRPFTTGRKAWLL